jgi:hypothetical protein
MNWVVTLYSAVLFFILTPGILVSLPPKSGKYIVALTHAVVFAIVWHFTHKLVWEFSITKRHEAFGNGKKEGLNEGNKNKGSK